ncbi:hypothetical protein T439DRAFT_325523 [Meredithblackwellia eburnea MCA 4105]
MYITLSLISLLLLFLLFLWAYRQRFLHLLPSSLAARIRHYAPIDSFEDQLENGFSTSNFSLIPNLAPGERDPRTGLDQRSLTEVRRIMDGMGVSFDEGRRIWVEREFRRNGIDPNGFPIDPKAVTSLS